MAEIINQLHQPDVPLVTLVGSCGMGKTRLAVEVAQNIDTAKFPGVRFFVPLVGLSDPTGLAARHGEFYLAFVAAREYRLARHESRQATEELCIELDNIRHAWQWGQCRRP